MLAFVTTLRHPATAFSWARVVELLERSLASVCRQAGPAFRVIVVCNERPTLQFSHPAVEFVEVDLPPPAASPRDLIGNMPAIHADRGRKHLAALRHLRADPPEHLMFFDADDLVSNRLAAYVASAPPADVYYADRGYGHAYGGRLMFLYRRNFHRFCGTCHVFRFAALAPELPPRAGALAFARDFLADHVGIVERFVADGRRVAKLPFPAAVYVVGTGENHSGVGSVRLLIERAKGGPLGRLAALRQLRPLSAALCEEFGIPRGASSARSRALSSR